MIDQQQVVRRRRSALALGRRHPQDDRTELDKLGWALEAAERYLAVVERRQVDWHRHRTFDRDLVERVLLMARIADFRGVAAQAGDTPQWSTDAPPPADDTAPPAVTNVAAVIAYLRRHHPPTD